MRKVIEAAIVAASLIVPSATMAFDLQGHRGARGLVPENTLEAFTRRSRSASPRSSSTSP